MKILNEEFEFDFYDADINEKIENSIEKTSKDIKNKMKLKSKKTSQVIREVCQIIFDFFDNLIGEGTSQKIFKGKTSLTVCIKAFEDFIDAKTQEEKRLEEISKKYSSNRATRRNKK